jgi:tetratricopeptide (TPR) repeat protein
MHPIVSVRRAVLLALSLLSACAASDPGESAGRYTPSGVFGNYLAGRVALADGNPDVAATDFLHALAGQPEDAELAQEAFLACLNAGRPEAVRLARSLPGNPVAQLLLADEAARTGNWAGAEQRYRALPRQGLSQLLQPLLVAWAQQGQGHTAAALATLQPFVENQRFRGLFALHAGMIADLGGQQQDAARFFQIARTDMPDLNLRLAAILASWYDRNGQPGEAQKVLAEMAATAPDTAIVLPRLIGDADHRPVATATEGLAEAYVAFAAALRAQDAGEFAMLVTRLALHLRPDFGAARLLGAEILAADHHTAGALAMLAQVPASDPLDPMVRLRRAALHERLGQTDAAVSELTAMAHDFPDSPVPQIELGDLLRGKQRFPEAIAAYDQAIAHMPHPARADWVVFYDRGISYERSHQWQKAEADFDQALKLSPDQPYVLNYLGYSWADMGQNLGRARAMIQRAAERRPNDGAITDSLGWVAFRQGDVAEAVRTLERAVELEPEDATINGHLGDAYWAAGRKIEARYQWQRALTLHPEPDDAAKLEAKLTRGSAPTPIAGAPTTGAPGPVVSGQ